MSQHNESLPALGPPPQRAPARDLGEFPPTWEGILQWCVPRGSFDV